MSPSRVIALFLSLLLAVDATAAVTKKKKKVEHVVRVTGLTPERVQPGETVTITGAHLDEVAAVLFDQDSPKITEKTFEKLVFVVPVREENQFYSAPIYLVLPGQPLMPTRLKVSVVPKAAAAPGKRKGDAAVDENGSLAANHPKSWPVALGESAAIEVSVTSKGGEVEARVEPARQGEPPLMSATYSGSLKWKLLARELGGKQVTVTLATDAAKADYHLVVMRSGSAVGPNDATRATGAKK
jgi:hypothetical protein